MVLTVSIVRQNQPSFTFFLYYWPIITILYIWVTAATAESTSERRFCALYEYVLHYPQGNERTGDIRSSWVDVTTAPGPILLRLGCATKMAVFRSYFRDFVGAQKIEDLSESKNVFAKVCQIKSRFVFGKKNWGLRCTLRDRFVYISRTLLGN